MTAFTAADTLHRLVKQAIDSGAAASLAEAEALFAGYRIALLLSDQYAARSQPSGRAADGRGACAACLPGRRHGCRARPSTSPDAATVRGNAWRSGAPAWRQHRTGARRHSDHRDRRPLLAQRQGGFHIRALFAGWRGGIVPAHLAASPAAGLGDAASADARGRAGGQRGVPFRLRRHARSRSPVRRVLPLAPQTRNDWFDAAARRARPRATAVAPVADRPGASRPGLSLGARPAALSRTRARCHWSCRTSTSSRPRPKAPRS